MSCQPCYTANTIWSQYKIYHILRLSYQDHHCHIPLQCCLPFKVRQKYDVWGSLTSATNWVGQGYEATGYWCFIKTQDTFLNCLWFPDWNLATSFFFCCNHFSDDWSQVFISHMPQQLSCHGMCKIVTWSSILFIEEQDVIFTKFGLWTNKPLEKWVPNIN